jgi:hypothetical protein
VTEEATDLRKAEKKRVGTRYISPELVPSDYFLQIGPTSQQCPHIMNSSRILLIRSEIGFSISGDYAFNT